MAVEYKVIPVQNGCLNDYYERRFTRAVDAARYAKLFDVMDGWFLCWICKDGSPLSAAGQGFPSRNVSIKNLINDLTDYKRKILSVYGG